MRRIILVTPRRDGITCESVESERQRCALLTDPRVAELPEDIRAEALEAPYDVVRSRSLAVAQVMLRFPDALGILWFDSDVIAPSMQTFGRLVSSGYPIVGCPVVRKKIVRWGDEREACDFAYRVKGDDGATVQMQADALGCIEVDGLPFGLMWTSLEALRRMVDHYRDELWFSEGGQEAVAIFALMMTPERGGPDGSRWRQMLSEDYSMLERWRAIGGTVHMLLDVCSHSGVHIFRGHIAGLKHVR